MSLSITPGTNNVGAYINSVDLKNLDQNQILSKDDIATAFLPVKFIHQFQFFKMMWKYSNI